MLNNLVQVVKTNWKSIAVKSAIVGGVLVGLKVVDGLIKSGDEVVEGEVGEQAVEEQPATEESSNETHD